MLQNCNMHFSSSSNMLSNKQHISFIPFNRFYGQKTKCVLQYCDDAIRHLMDFFRYFFFLFQGSQCYSFAFICNKQTIAAFAYKCKTIFVLLMVCRYWQPNWFFFHFGMFTRERWEKWQSTRNMRRLLIREQTKQQQKSSKKNKRICVQMH